MAAHPINGLSLCAGVGGIDAGLRLAIGSPAYRTVCYVEREAFQASVLVTRMDEGELDPAPIWSDLRTFDASYWRGRVDLVHGGYPCQPFSVAGKQRADEDPRHLWPEVLRVLREAQPALALFENVAGHVNLGLREVLKDLAGLGFDAEWDLFSAAEEGACHHRSRLFLLAGRPLALLRLRELLVFDPRTARLRVRVPGDKRVAREPLRTEEAAPHARGEGLQGQEAQERLCLSGVAPVARRSWWGAEPVVGRVGDGVPNRVDRLWALGNSVVPAVAARAFTELYGRLTDDL